MKTYRNFNNYIVLMALSLFWAQLSSGQGNLVFNGGFDTSAAGWAITNVSLGGGYESTKGNPPGDVVLDATPSSSTDPTISQTINGLTVGAIYVVSGDYRYITDRGGAQTGFSFGVAINSVFLFEATQQTTNPWENFSFLYPANSSSAVLSLAAQRNGTGFTFAIDNIAFQAIPEPSSLALLSCGGLMLATRLLRVRKG